MIKHHLISRRLQEDPFKPLSASSTLNEILLVMKHFISNF